MTIDLPHGAKISWDGDPKDRSKVSHILIDGEPRCTFPTIPFQIPCAHPDPRVMEIVRDHIATFYAKGAKVEVVPGECSIETPLKCATQTAKRLLGKLVK